MLGIVVRPGLGFAVVCLALVTGVNASTIAQGDRFRKCWEAKVPGHYGKVFIREDPGYNDRMTRNYEPDPTKAPFAFVDCENEFAVQAAIRCAAENGLQVCPRSGGHSRIGSSMCDGVVLEMGLIGHLQVSENASKASVGPGLTNGVGIYHLLKNYSRLIPVGKCASVALGGYILGGGLSEFSDKLGFACDNLVSVSGVDGMGNIVHASQTVNQDLFWAACGGGAGQFMAFFNYTLNTAVSTVYDNFVGFRYRTPIENVPQVLHWYFGFTDQEASNVQLRLRLVIKGSTNKGNNSEYMDLAGACYATSDTAQCRDLMVAKGFNSSMWNERIFMPGYTAMDLIKFYAESEMFTDEKALLEHGMLYVEGSSSRDNVRVTALGFRYQGNGSIPTQPPIDYFVNYIQQSQTDCNMTGLRKCITIFQALGSGITSISENSTALYGLRLSTHWISIRIEARLTYENASSDSLIRHQSYLAAESMGNFVNYQDDTLGSSYPEAYYGPGYTRLQSVKALFDPWNIFLSSQPVTLPPSSLLRRSLNVFPMERSGYEDEPFFWKRYSSFPQVQPRLDFSSMELDY
uniref:FAD-binding PCMH-type domain-containing protein n=1 Tax=Compsopogon caeruleus TaxID=31354 RepID=A0A7S1T864_9RHOD|mmetsp:Transcript_12723/g.25819  ORF Transcript_12723/g.25819 Transcript_12723/m.25819 type:complete len:575 (+) Transcript_12723:71-1795(+)